MAVLSTVKLGAMAVCANFIGANAYDTSVPLSNAMQQQLKGQTTCLWGCSRECGKGKNGVWVVTQRKVCRQKDKEKLKTKIQKKQLFAVEKWLDENKGNKSCNNVKNQYRKYLQFKKDSKKDDASKALLSAYQLVMAPTVRVKQQHKPFKIEFDFDIDNADSDLVTDVKTIAKIANIRKYAQNQQEFEKYKTQMNQIGQMNQNQQESR